MVSGDGRGREKTMTSQENDSSNVIAPQGLIVVIVVILRDLGSVFSVYLLFSADDPEHHRSLKAL